MAPEQTEHRRHSVRTARVGIISDTHGLLRSAALEELRGSDRIIHAGDVGHDGILAQLADLAPVTSVRGNVDTAPWARRIPLRADLAIAGVHIHVVHRMDDLEPGTGARVVITGHSHQPVIREADGVLYLNPGSAGPRRFRLPISLALLEIGPGGKIAARLIELPA